MPATEKTWRDQARMHVIFGISSLVMLVGTIWMLAKDHNREWRKWQLDDRARERVDDRGPARPGRGGLGGQAGQRLRNAARGRSAAPRSTPQLVERFKELRCEQKTRGCEAEAAGDRRLQRRWTRRSTELESPKRRNRRSARMHARELLEPAWTISSARPSAAKTRSLTEKKFVAADQTAAVSARGIAVGEGQPTGRDRRRRSQSSPTQIVELDAAGRRRQGLSHRAGSGRQRNSSRRGLDLETANRRARNRPRSAARKHPQHARVHRRMDQPLPRCSTRSTPATSSSTRFGCRT